MNNILVWKTIKIAKLTMPYPNPFSVGALREQGHQVDIETEPCPGYIDAERIAIRLCELGEISGHALIAPRPGFTEVQIRHIDLSGERSGSAFTEIVMPWLRQSHGQLEAVLVWEGGAIQRITVDDGRLVTTGAFV